MTKSIVSGGVVLVAVVVIVLGLFGVYDLSDAGLLSWGAVGMIATILFAAFGGFKPFFTTAETLGEQSTDDDAFAAPAEWSEAAALDSETTQPRRLISVGVDPDAAPRRPLFEDRPPSVRPPEPVSERTSDDRDQPRRRTLFGEALGERLAEERPPAEPPSDDAETDRGEGEPATSLADEAAAEHTLAGEATNEEDVTGGTVDDEVATESDDVVTESIVVDDDPSWVSTDLEEIDSSAEPSDDIGDEWSAEPDAEPVAEALGEAEAETEFEETEPVATEDAVADDEALDDAMSSDLPVALRQPPAIELHAYSSDEVMTVVKAQERDLVETLIGEGLLTTEGPITDRDVRTMVFVAVSSTELIEVLTASLDGGVDGQHANPAALEEGHESS